MRLTQVDSQKKGLSPNKKKKRLEMATTPVGRSVGQSISGLLRWP